MKLSIKNKDKNTGFSKKRISSIWMLVIATGVVFFVFALLNKYFLTLSNIMTLLQYSAITGVACCGMIFVIISGSLDLSTGSIAALAAVYAARVVEVTDNWWLAVLVGLAIGLAAGCVNGTLITVCKINPLITTLGTMTIFKGIAHLENEGVPIAVFNKSFKILGQSKIGGVVPTIVVILLLSYIIFGLILTYTRFGRKVYSVGGNALAAYYAGININSVRFKIYALAGLMAGLAGVLYASLTGSGSPGSNSELALEAISAVILGGTALSGGRGKMIGVVIGAVLIASITNALTLMNISSFYQMIIKGVILILAVELDVLKGEGAYN